MNPENLNSLKQAAELIKTGKTKPARGLIINVLREDPENAQAWYMLSFTVPKIDKQIYALQQVIRLVPDHQKAIDRLSKLSDATAQNATTGKTEKSIEISNTLSSKETIETPGEDLLSQRLFGEAPSEKEPRKVVEEEVKESKPPVFYHEIAEQAEHSQDGSLQEDYASTTIEKSSRKILGIPLNLFIIFGILAIVGLTAILVSSPKIIDLLKNSSPELLAGINTLESQSQPTETQLPQNTPTTIPSTPTPQPTETSTVLNLFSAADLLPALEDDLLEFETIQSGIQSILNTSINSSPTVYPISDSRLQTFIWDYAKIEGYEDHIKQNQKFFEILGLANPGDDFSSFYQNIWVDPNGTLFLPDKQIIAIVGFDFSEYQKYSYAQAYTQFILSQEYSAETSQFYPPCLDLTEQCEINLAIFKGDAAFTAWQWASQTYEEETLNKINQTNKKLFYNPIFSPPKVMEAIRLFPYEYGFAFVDGIYQQGGWAEVENLFNQLPSTTEQILHPEKYLTGEIGQTINSTNLSDILSAEWQSLYSGSLGEWKTYLILSEGTPGALVDNEAAKQAAAGWNGDQIQVFTKPSGESILTSHWKFDTETDTEEFYNTLNLYTTQRFAGTTINLSSISCQDNGNQISCLILKDDDVVWVVGTDSQTIELVLENYEFLQTD
ncbi:MAG: hypothetical protein P8Y68_04760 [Anaerolineales bacterium]